MSFWDWLRGGQGRPRTRAAAPSGPAPLPGEPYVLECRECGKVFDSTQRRSPCPECDAVDVEVLSD